MDDHGFMVIICRNYTPDELTFWQEYAATVTGYFDEVADQMVHDVAIDHLPDPRSRFTAVIAQLAMAADTMLDIVKL